MNHVTFICAIAATLLGTLMFRDPSEWVRVWATIGFSVAVVGAYVSVCAIDDSDKRNK